MKKFPQQAADLLRCRLSPKGNFPTLRQGFNPSYSAETTTAAMAIQAVLSEV
jgi:hypothetical protein